MIIIARVDEDVDADVEVKKEMRVTIEEDSDSDDEITMSIEIEDDGDSIVEKRIKKVIVMKDEDGNYTTSVEDMDSDINVWVEKMGEEGVKKTITVEVIKTEKVEVSVDAVEAGDPDLEGFDLGDYKSLNLKSFMCNPNPNEGQFNLAFTASAKSLSIRIYNKSGKKIFFEKIEDFSGNYSKEIDLGGKDKGTYVLQISQGGKAVNKKLLIE
jgi:hypothetical protein